MVVVAVTDMEGHNMTLILDLHHHHMITMTEGIPHVGKRGGPLPLVKTGTLMSPDTHPLGTDMLVMEAVTRDAHLHQSTTEVTTGPHVQQPQTLTIENAVHYPDLHLTTTRVGGNYPPDPAGDARPYDGGPPPRAPPPSHAPPYDEFRNGYRGKEPEPPGESGNYYDRFYKKPATMPPGSAGRGAPPQSQSMQAEPLYF